MKNNVLNLKNKFKITPNTVDKRMENETLLINLSSNEICSLNSTAARFWELLSINYEQEKILQILLDEYDVPEETLLSEVKELTESLKEKGFICSV